MKKMKRIFTLLSLLVLFSTTILVPFASAQERELLYNTSIIQIEADSQSEYDLKVLDIIKELETSDEGVLIEEYQGNGMVNVHGAGVITPGDYFIAGIGTVTVLLSGAIIINNKIWEAGSSMANDIIDYLFSSKPEPVYKTDKEAQAAAGKLGYSKVNETCGKTAIFKKAKKAKKGPGYIS